MMMLTTTDNANIRELVAEAVQNRKSKKLPVTPEYVRSLTTALMRFRAQRIRTNLSTPKTSFKRMPAHTHLWTHSKPSEVHAFSKVWIGTVTRKLQRWMRQLQFDARVPYAIRNIPLIRKQIVLKIQTFDPKNTHETWMQFLNRCINEVNIQKTLNIPGNPARSYVPKLYFGGLVQGTRHFVMVMDKVPGTPLQNIVNRDVWKSKVLRAYRALRQAGIHHGDLHGGNILVDEKTKRVFFIDFGSAVAYGRYKPGARKLKAVTFAQGQQMVPNNIQMLILFGGYQTLFNAAGKRRPQ